MCNNWNPAYIVQKLILEYFIYLQTNFLITAIRNHWWVLDLKMDIAAATAGDANLVVDSVGIGVQKLFQVYL